MLKTQAIEHFCKIPKTRDKLVARRKELEEEEKAEEKEKKTRPIRPTMRPHGDEMIV